ncbi:MAG TPA: tRNA (adenosine(37)-N6)-dimethylallyltransferase MiaA [Candidatus Omnitrophota bacterium]|nr:tRNA (adenosine(37)-N6)-dimethylallyltransferase MiaA [Candidatus Omnitrophota bacterium]
MPQNKPQILFLIGPTAIGKSRLAVQLAAKINAEIISLDSMQIYLGLEILSSQPSRQMQKKVRHHLLNIVNPNQEFDAAEYRKLALKKIKEIQAAGKIPLFAGGTGLYLSIVIDGIFKDVKKDEALREKLYAQAAKKGSVFLHNKLKKIDHAAAAKIHPNDAKRIIRALEVYKRTGKPISRLWKTRKGLDTSKYDIKVFGLNKEREGLYRDINQRVEDMFSQGLVNEVKSVLARNPGLTGRQAFRTSRQAIGIREIQGYLAGQYDLERAKEMIKKNTRNYAKRQLTWFRKDKRIIWLEASQKNLPGQIVKLIK